ncbi:MAG: transketolase [Armatimonadetes bacterium]|nr:MAG: transketolase [Armatimonadota bacterium]
MPLPKNEFLRFQALSLNIRQEIIRILTEAGSGHPAGSLSAVEILVSLYFRILRHDPQKPNWEQRDRFVLSNGHICPALYIVLAYSGYFPKEKLLTLRRLYSSLQGHPHREELSGLETSSGPLGCGLSQSCGMALTAKMDKKRWRVVCLMSDGEQEEGNVWEAVMFAVKNKLDNLIAVIDQNGIQIDGFTKSVMMQGSLKEKYEAFGWQVFEIDGHNFSELIDVFGKATEVKSQPVAIIANTTAGKGVAFMENKPEWHGRTLNKEESIRALKELKEGNV